MERLADLHAHQFVVSVGRALPTGWDRLRACFGGENWLNNAVSPDRHCVIGTWVRHIQMECRGKVSRPPLRIAIGDISELGVSSLSSAHPANVSWVDVDPFTATLEAQSSRTGLPPIFYAHYSDGTLVASDLRALIVALDRVPDLDPQGMAEVLRWGYPLDGHTIFSGVRVLDLASILKVRGDGLATVTGHIQCPSKFGSASLEEVMEAFRTAVSRMPLDNAFLSLSGGLDSRAVAVAAVAGGYRPDCVTLAPSDSHHDLVQAKLVARELGLRHRSIILDSTYYSQLPLLVGESATYTGGVSSIAQTADLYMYKTLAGIFSARVTGNFGNQVGRGGVESIPFRRSTKLLTRDLKDHVCSQGEGVWYLHRAGDGYPVHVRLCEAMWYGVANYGIGSGFMPQLSPYADESVLRSAIKILATSVRPGRLVTGLLARDIRHRLVGPRKDTSFQIKYLQMCGLPIDSIPINLGWTVAGRINSRTLRQGALALLAAYLFERAPKLMELTSGLRPLGSCRRTLAPLIDSARATSSLREYFMDTMHEFGQSTPEGIDPRAFRSAMDEAATGKCTIGTELTALFEAAIARAAFADLLTKAKARVAH